MSHLVLGRSAKHRGTPYSLPSLLGGADSQAGRPAGRGFQSPHRHQPFLRPKRKPTSSPLGLGPLLSSRPLVASGLARGLVRAEAPFHLVLVGRQLSKAAHPVPCPSSFHLFLEKNFPLSKILNNLILALVL